MRLVFVADSACKTRLANFDFKGHQIIHAMYLPSYKRYWTKYVYRNHDFPFVTKGHIRPAASSMLIIYSCFILTVLVLLWTRKIKNRCLSSNDKGNTSYQLVLKISVIIPYIVTQPVPFTQGNISTLYVQKL